LMLADNNPSSYARLNYFMSFLIEPLCGCNLDELASLEKQSFSSDRISRRSFRRLLTRPTADGCGIYKESVMLGYSLLLFRRNTTRARLYSLAVDKDHRGKGVGRSLLEATVQLARERGSNSLQLEVSSTNIFAIRLYETFGFNLRARRRAYYEDGNDALVYSLELQNDLHELGASSLE